MARVGEKEVKNPQECDLRRLRSVDYLEAPKKENKEILIAPQLTVMTNNYMNHQPEKCCEKCVDGLVYPTSVCLIKDCKCHQPKPEVKCEHAETELVYSGGGDANPVPSCKKCGANVFFTPASTEAGYKVSEKEVQRFSKAYQVNEDNSSLPPPASTEEWELRSGFRCAKMCVCKQNNADGVNKKEV